jgi:hypothetical protein
MGAFVMASSVFVIDAMERPTLGEGINVALRLRLIELVLVGRLASAARRPRRSH